MGKHLVKKQLRNEISVFQTGHDETELLIRGNRAKCLPLSTTRLPILNRITNVKQQSKNNQNHLKLYSKNKASSGLQIANAQVALPGFQT